MRRIAFALAATLALVLSFVLPQGSATGKRAGFPSCELAPFSYNFLDWAWTNDLTRTLLRYSANGSTTLACPEGHPWNGHEVNVEVSDAKVKFEAGPGELMTDTATLKGRAQYVVDIPIEIVSLSFKAKIRGTSSPDGGGGSTLDLSIAGRASDRTKLRLHEVGTLDQVTGDLVSLACSSGTLGVLFSDGRG